MQKKIKKITKTIFDIKFRYMKLSDFNYNLPKNLIAQNPKKSRDKSRFLVYNIKKNKLINDYFYNLKAYLKPGDLIILNNTKVFPARLIGKKETGGKIEVLLLNQDNNNWNALIGGKTKENQTIIFSNKLIAKIIRKYGKKAIISFNINGEKLLNNIYRIGKTPIPPYIKNSKLSEIHLRNNYQTVFAESGISSAAPTAGMHFSERQIGELKGMGIKFANINLSIGLGTFAKITNKDIKNKKLPFENFCIPYSTIKKIVLAKNSNNKIIAVGTTTVRALESIGNPLFRAKKSIVSKTNLFIQPGYKFKIVDSIVSNFHLPQTSLMFLIAAFLQDKSKSSNLDFGRKKLLTIYQHSIKNQYMFYSFGDCMMII